jgi:adenine phosphoribosyltransferase
MIRHTPFTYLIEVYKNAHTVWNTGKFTTVNELCDQVPALRPEVLQEAVDWLVSEGSFSGNRIVTEEDKGAILAGVVSLRTKKSLAVARWYPYKLPDSAAVKVQMQSEYREGDLYLNGVLPGDRVTIIEDTISSGGTIIALVDAVQKCGADVTEILAVVEKIGFGGVDRVMAQTGIRVKTGIGITVDETGVVHVITQPALEEVLA